MLPISPFPECLLGAIQLALVHSESRDKVCLQMPWALPHTSLPQLRLITETHTQRRLECQSLARGTGKVIQRLPSSIYTLRERPLPTRHCARLGQKNKQDGSPAHKEVTRQETCKQATSTQRGECYNRRG